MIFTKLIIIKNSMFSNIMNCESKTKSKLTAYPTLQAKSFITQKTFFIFFIFSNVYKRDIQLYKVYVLNYSFFHFRYLQFNQKKEG